MKIIYPEKMTGAQMLHGLMFFVAMMVTLGYLFSRAVPVKNDLVSQDKVQVAVTEGVK